MAWDIGAYEYGASPGPVPGPTTPPSETPAPGYPPPGSAGPGGSDDVAPISVRQSGGAAFILARLFLDSGTEYEAKRQIIVGENDHFYEARVKEFGFVDRSIPVPSGLPQLGDCKVVVIDTDRKWRDLFFNQTPRRRLFDLRIVLEGESESERDPFATFEVYNVEFPAGLAEIYGRDITFAWIDRKIPGLINRTNFPDLMEGVDEAFMPIIGGILDAPSTASPPNPQGVLTLPRMTLSRWGAAQHPLAYVELCGRAQSEDLFALINPADYVVTEEATTIDGVDYTLSFIDFNSPQADGFEVRYRIVEGFETRGEFGGMPAVQNSPISGLRNPIDLLINVLYGVLKTETRIPRFNVDSFTTLRDYFNTSFITTVSPAIGYSCDGAIIEPITVREFLADWCTSFEVDLFVNRNGELTVNATFDTDPARPVFSDGPIFGDATDNSLISLNSVRQSLANPTCNRIKYLFGKNYSEDTFQYVGVYNNDDDQLALGGAESPAIPFLEEQTVEYKWVRELPIAQDVAVRRMEFLALGSYRIEHEMPLPEVFDDVELAKLYGVTHYGGLAEGGYSNTEFKTTGLTYDLDRLALILRGILRVPMTVDQTTPINPAEGEFFTGSVPLYMLCGSNIFFDELAMRWTATDLYIDPANYTKEDESSAIVAAWFEANIEDNTSLSLGAYTLELINETDTVVATITTDGVITKHAKRYRVAFDSLPTAAHTYRLRNGGELGSYNLTCNDAKVILDLEDAYRVKLMVALLVTGDQSTSGPFNYDSEATVNRALYCIDNSSTTYTVNPITATTKYWVGKFLKDSSKFATIESWELEGVASQFKFLGDSGDGGEATQNGNIALFNSTDNTQVTGAELTFTPGTSRQSVTFADSAANFDDLDEFEPRFKVVSDPESIGVARVTVYVQLTAATKALYIAGLALNGLSIPFAAPNLNTESGRYYHDASKFPATAKFYYELTGQQRGNTVPVARINDAGDVDYGDQSSIGTPTAASGVSGSWTNVNNAGDDGQAGGTLSSLAALFTSAISLGVAELQQTGFTFTPAIPGGVTITQVNYILRLVIDSADESNQTEAVAVKINSQPFHSISVTETLETPGGSGNFTIKPVLYDATPDTGWLVSDFSSPTVNVKVTHPANVVSIDAWIAGGQLFIGWSDTLVDSELLFTATTRVRQRSAELTLTDQHRYTALNPGSAVATNKIDHAAGVILAEVDVLA